jgi:hypothetical protein
MKKIIILMVLFMGITIGIYAQTIDTTEFGSLINLLGESNIPTGYARIGRNLYTKSTKNGDITIATSNDIIIVVFIGGATDNSGAAAAFVGPAYNYFDKNGGIYYSTIDHGDIYKISGIYALINSGFKREDGKIVCGVEFALNLRDIG